MVALRTDMPLLVSIPEAAFQLSVSNEDIASLIRDGEIVGVTVRGQVLVSYESLRLFAKRGCGAPKRSPK
jgi:excisionase family DNA binding protein